MKGLIRITAVCMLISGGTAVWADTVIEAVNDVSSSSNAWMLLEKGKKYLVAGSLSNAIICLDQSFAIYRSTAEPGITHTAAAGDMLANAYMAFGFPAKAEETMATVCLLYEQSGNTNGNAYTEACRKAGLICYYQGKYHRAVRYFSIAAMLHATLHGAQNRETAKLYHLTGANYYLLGKYTDAEAWYTRALVAKEAAFGTNHTETASTINNLAILYDAQGKYDVAEPLYRRALAIKKEVLGENHPETAHELNNLAILHQARKEYDPAESLLHRALTVRMHAYGTNHMLTAQSLNNLAQLYLLQGRLRKAEPLLQQALQIRRTIYGTNHIEAAQSHHALGKLYAAEGKFDKAQDAYTVCMSIRETAFGPAHHAVAELYRDIGDMHRSRSNYHNAATWYEQALDSWEAAAAGTGGEAFSGMIRTEQQALCSRYLEIRQQLQQETGTINAADIEKSFQAMERARARQLLDQLAAASASWRGDLTADDRTREDVLRREASDVQERKRKELIKPTAEQNSQLLANYGLTLGTLQRRISELEREFAGKYPRYMDIRKPELIGIDEMQTTILISNEVFLGFWEGESHLFACLITRSDSGFYSLPYDRKAVKKKILRYYLALADEKSLEEYRVAAYDVYRSIIQPFFELIDTEDASAVLIAPHGMLSAIVFESLVTSTNGKSFAELDYLFNEIPITYIPSAMVLRAIRKDTRAGRFTDSNRQPAILFGDPIYTEAQARNAGLMARNEKRNDSPRTIQNGSTRVFRNAGGEQFSIPALPGTRQEIEAIAVIFYPSNDNQNIYLGARVQEQAVKQLNAEGKLSRYRFVHFATHAFLPREIKGLTEPSLALSLYGTGSEDGFLKIDEILDLRLNANLVALSACETGWVEGSDRMEGISGLARAFFFAGTPSMLVTQLDIDDDSTAAFMSHFYTSLNSSGSEMPLVTALNQTRQYMLTTRHAHPSLWAPFILVGDWR